jgi:hypothetical protein
MGTVEAFWVGVDGEGKGRLMRSFFIEDSGVGIVDPDCWADEFG